MSLRDLGKNDISEETQAFKDKLASRETENAGLRTQLMRREAELEELQATFNETVYKLSREAERALKLEEEVSTRASELKTERISLRNTESALQSAQEKLKAEERTKKELESTLDTVSLHSQATSTEHQSVQREKRALESRVRELERIVQTHEAKGVSNVPRRNGRPRSSSVSNFRLPAMEQELNDTKAQLLNRDKSLRVLEQKLAQAQDNLVKAENMRISIDKTGQKRVSELLSVLERKDEELESLRGADNTGEREEELLKRIDEDAAKIAALEKLAAESQATRTTQTRIQKLQSQLKVECEKVHRSEDLQNRLLCEKEELARQYAASQRELADGHELLLARAHQLEGLEARHARLLADFETRKKILSLHEHPSSQSQRLNGVLPFPNESALADHIQTLLQAIDRLRNERDGLKRALEFSEVEYRITTESFQSRIASLTSQLVGNTHDIMTDKSNACVEQKTKRLTSCSAALIVVISHLQTRLDISEDRVSATSADLASSNSRLHDALTVIDNQKQSLVTNTHEHDGLLQKLDVVVKELSESDEERDRLRLQLTDMEGHVTAADERVKASEVAREEAYQSFLLVEQRFASLNKNCQDVESERNSLAVQVTNLQDELARVRGDLVDAQNRYNTLHAQQLSAMSTSEVVGALKDRIKELEARIVRCTDQISDYQHDIRRLEANGKLHEERIAEMTSELEVLASEKEAMVEDCAEARGTRDETIEKLEVAEEEVERVQQRLQQAKEAHEEELSVMSSMMANLTSENQQASARLANLEGENVGFTRELDSLGRNHRHLCEQLDATTSRSQFLELENLKANAEIQQAVISLAVLYGVYRDCARRLVDTAEKDKQDSVQRLSNVSMTEDRSRAQDDLMSRSHLEMTTEELHDAGVLQNLLQEREFELASARQWLEEAKSHYAEVEAGLMERIATITTELQAQRGQDREVANMQAELESLRTQLKNSLENFTELDKLHGDVVQDFTAATEVFERRLVETDQQIRLLETDHQRSLTTMEAEYRHEADILTSNLEDREREVDELRHRLQDVSDAYTRVEAKFHEELKSYETNHALASDLEKDLRRTVADVRQRLAQAEAEALALQEERQLLQAQITSLQAEIQRSTSLTRYLENQVRESEDACMLLKESLQQSEFTLAESEKASKAAEFNLTLQSTQHDKLVAALRREIASLQSGPELRSALAELKEKNREMDDLLRAKCQEIEEHDDRVLETLKANKKLTSKVESLTRKVQALQAKLSLMKNQPQECAAEAIPQKKATSIASPPIPGPAATYAGSQSNSSHIRESPGPLLALRAKTPEPRIQPIVAPPPSCTPGRTSEPPECEVSAGKKRPAPDDDERDSVPAEGHYSTDAYLRNGPTPRLRRTHGHPAGFTPVRGASLRKATGTSSPGRRAHAGVAPSEIITDVTNSPRGPSVQKDVHLKKKSWLGKIRSGGGSQTASSRLGAFGGQ